MSMAVSSHPGRPPRATQTESLAPLGAWGESLDVACAHDPGGGASSVRPPSAVTSAPTTTSPAPRNPAADIVEVIGKAGHTALAARAVAMVVTGVSARTAPTREASFPVGERLGERSVRDQRVQGGEGQHPEAQAAHVEDLPGVLSGLTSSAQPA